MKAYKGFNKDMTCRGFQYEEGKSYETDRASCCREGFHACENPLDCLYYYCLYDESVYHEVEMGGDIDHNGGDSKIAATKITIGARLTFAGLVKAAIDYTIARVKPEAKAYEDHGFASVNGVRSAASATGHHSVASATGHHSVASATGHHSVASATGRCSAASAMCHYSAASVTGECSAASTTDYNSVASAAGDCSAASVTGDYSVASATGVRSAASATGYNSEASAENETAIAVAWGVHGKARGVKGSHIVLADWRNDVPNYNWYLCGAKMVCIDGEKYKADTWYTMKCGKIVEAEG